MMLGGRRAEVERLSEELKNALLESAAQRTTLRIQRERLAAMRGLLDEYWSAFLAEQRASAEQAGRLRKAQRESEADRAQIVRLQARVERLQRALDRCSNEGTVREAS